jgi:hypothetical protein
MCGLNRLNNVVNKRRYVQYRMVPIVGGKPGKPDLSPLHIHIELMGPLGRHDHDILLTQPTKSAQERGATLAPAVEHAEQAGILINGLFGQLNGIVGATAHRDA